MKSDRKKIQILLFFKGATSTKIYFNFHTYHRYLLKTFMQDKKEYSFKDCFTQLCPHFRPLSCSLAWQPPYAITKECERTLKLQNQLMSRSRFPALKIYWRYHTVQWVNFDKIFQGQDVKKSKKYYQNILLICQQNENFTTLNKSLFYAILVKNQCRSSWTEFILS